jgi:hypothetical protein
MDARAAMALLVFEQSGDSGSLTVTFVSVTSPVLVTTIVNVADWPLSIVWPLGFFVIEIAGLLGGDDGGGVDGGGVDGGGGAGVTVTGAVSVADTSGPPLTGVPVAVALFV